MEILKEAYKIWKNPATAEESPRFMGEFYPPSDQSMFIHADLKVLGFRLATTPFAFPTTFGSATPYRSGRR
jgi:hypothetical protein